MLHRLCIFLCCLISFVPQSTNAQSCVGELGKIEWLTFRKIGTSSDLRYMLQQPQYPTQPDRVVELTSTMTASQYDDNFGGLIRGFIIAPLTGNYRFNLTGDDNSVLFLSTDSTRTNFPIIASINSWTAETEHNKLATQTSSLIPMVAGKPYYFEALYKEGNGGDFVRIYWKTPATLTDTTWQIIPSANLAKQTCIPVCPKAGTVCDDGNPNTTNDTYTNGCQCLGQPAALPACVGEYGSVKTLFWDGVSGNSINNLLSNAAYPLMPSRGEATSSLFKTGNTVDNFGSRTRGFLRVPVSGNYRFNIVGDDRVRLLFGTDKTGATATQIANNTTTASTFEHYKEAGQTSPLLALSKDSLYYFELLYKETFGGENVGLYWRTPFATDTFWRVLDGSYLYQFGCELACFPANTPCNDNDPNTFNDRYNNQCTCVGTPCADPACSNALGYTPNEPCGTTENHSNASKDAWVSCSPSPNPNINRDIGHWIKYDMGQVYALSGSQIWNYNTIGQTDQGFNLVAIDYSLDGNTWHTLGEYNWEQAPGVSGYSGFNFQALEGMVARYVLITALDNFSTDSCMGLSEVSLLALQCDETGFGCDDGDPLTINDTYGYDCKCRGLSTAENACGELELITTSGFITSGQYDASEIIWSDGKVAPSDKVRLVSSQTIVLTEGFRAAKGAHFQAVIAPCSSQALSRMSNQDNSDTLAPQGPRRKSDFLSLQVAPNPARHWTKVKFHLPAAGKVRLGVFSTSGQLVLWLIDGEMPAGYGSKDLPAHQLSGGLYFVMLQTGDQVKSEQFIVID